MCYNCGCSLPHDSMGDERNITEKTLSVLARKKGLTLAELKNDLLHCLQNNSSALDPEYEKMFKEASLAWGQPIHEAMKQTHDLLKQEE